MTSIERRSRSPAKGRPLSAALRTSCDSRTTSSATWSQYTDQSEPRSTMTSNSLGVHGQRRLVAILQLDLIPTLNHPLANETGVVISGVRNNQRTHRNKLRHRSPYRRRFDCPCCTRRSMGSTLTNYRCSRRSMTSGVARRRSKHPAAIEHRNHQGDRHGAGGGKVTATTPATRAPTLGYPSGLAAPERQTRRASLHRRLSSTPSW